MPAVEDNHDTARSLELVLRLSGYEPTVAPDGLIALRIFQEMHPQVVLLDIGLPGLDGFEVARRIRHTDKMAFIIAITGYGGKEIEGRSKEAGIDLHLLKPVDCQKLLMFLSRLCVVNER